jgi:hypothetical protein
MRRTLRALAVLLLVGLVSSPPAPAAAQCVMCKTALTNSDEGRGISRQFNQAILLMLVAPYLLMGAAAGYLLRARIRGWAARAAVRLRPLSRTAAQRG